MTISELEEKLVYYKSQYGDVTVKIEIDYFDGEGGIWDITL